MIGVVVRKQNRNQTPPWMFIHSIGEGLRTSIDMCRGCKRWVPGSTANCSINEEYRKLEIATQTRSLRTMCPGFEPRETRDG